MSEFTLVKIPHCWKSHVTANMASYFNCLNNTLAVNKTVVGQSTDYCKSIAALADVMFKVVILLALFLQHYPLD